MEIIFANNKFYIVPETSYERFMLQDYFRLEKRFDIATYTDQDTDEFSHVTIETKEVENKEPITKNINITTSPISEEEIEQMYKKSLDEMEIDCEVDL
jgi:hypothetical protein